MSVGLFKGLLSPILKSPLFPLFQRGIIMSSPLWKRGVRGDFVKIFSLDWNNSNGLNPKILLKDQP
jgi:hypothetical protein